MFCQIFLSPQVKRCAIITYKHGIIRAASQIAERLKDIFTTPFSPMEGPMCPHKKKKKKGTLM